MAARVREMSTCPRCRARGVKLFEPIIKDGFQADVPYCGQCGKNWPQETTIDPPRFNVTSIEDHR